MGEATLGAREAILHAFWTLYRQKPLDQILVTEVARSARVHRSTCYRHFDDLRGALDALEDQTVAHIADEFGQAFALDGSINAASVADTLRAVVEQYGPFIRGLFDKDISDEVASYLVRVALSTFLTSMAYAYGLSLSEAPEAPYQSTMRIFMGDIVPNAI